MLPYKLEVSVFCSVPRCGVDQIIAEFVNIGQLLKGIEVSLEALASPDSRLARLGQQGKLIIGREFLINDYSVGMLHVGDLLKLSLYLYLSCSWKAVL